MKQLPVGCKPTGRNMNEVSMEAQTSFQPKFDLGMVVVTPQAMKKLTQFDVISSLRRHISGDWGEVCEEDWEENDLSLREGFRLLSVYRTADGTKIWVITEHDRSATTVLLPADY